MSSSTPEEGKPEEGKPDAGKPEVGKPEEGKAAEGPPAERGAPSNERLITIGVAALCVVAAFFAGRASLPPSAAPGSASAAAVALSESPRPAPELPRAAPRDPMELGLEALYSRRDPVTAAARFREVLAQNAGHYGATYQLATALDQLGDIAASRALWQRMLPMAEAIGDSKTAEVARTRLAEIEKLAPSDPDAEAMRLGMQALYEKRDPDGAAAQFRAVLGRTPSHYGATFQLASALDMAKKPAEARPLWEKVLRMAEAAKDAKTADAARARLAQKP